VTESDQSREEQQAMLIRAALHDLAMDGQRAVRATYIKDRIHGTLYRKDNISSGDIERLKPTKGEIETYLDEHTDLGFARIVALESSGDWLLTDVTLEDADTKTY